MGGHSRYILHAGGRSSRSRSRPPLNGGSTSEIATPTGGSSGGLVTMANPTEEEQGRRPGSSATGSTYSDTIPQLARRRTRVGTLRTVATYDDSSAACQQQDHQQQQQQQQQHLLGWRRPGSEPGVDTSRPDGGHASIPTLRAECQITVVDFSQANMVIHELDNAGLIEFLKVPQPGWVKCRWVNVNGLSWDVIQALGQYKNLHSLAIEDLMNTNNRTKADWYFDHAFLVLTLQKLVDMSDEDDGNDTHGFFGKRKTISRMLTSMFSRKPKAGGGGLHTAESGTSSSAPLGNSNNNNNSTAPPHPHSGHHMGGGDGGGGLSKLSPKSMLRSLHKYHAGPNVARTEYMERHSALASQGLAVVAEQVSIFITADNTVIAFFEDSADDVELPILTRLNSPSTILRRSCDASMVGQAILDAIIDMAVPVQAAYSDAIGDIELDVLTRPSIQQSKALYIIVSEINKMRSFIQPIINLINALRDHQVEQARVEANPTNHPAKEEVQQATNKAIITPITYTYLGDVLDNCVLINDILFQITKAADDMIDLIFNTITANQNEALKLLTLVTIIFLPMTFITGFFGQNFDPFPELDRGITFFWQIAVPVVIGTVVIFMGDMIVGYFKFIFQRRHRLGLRKNRRLRSRHTI